MSHIIAKAPELGGSKRRDMRESVEEQGGNEPHDADALDVRDVGPVARIGRERLNPSQRLPPLVQVLERPHDVGAMIEATHALLQVRVLVSGKQVVDEHVGVASHGGCKVDVLGEVEAKVSLLVDRVVGLRVALDEEEGVDVRVAGAGGHRAEPPQRRMESIWDGNALEAQMMADGDVGQNHGGGDQGVRGVVGVLGANLGCEARGGVNREAYGGE